jgi:hypothetical protein
MFLFLKYHAEAEYRIYYLRYSLIGTADWYAIAIGVNRNDQTKRDIKYRRVSMVFKIYHQRRVAVVVNLRWCEHTGRFSRSL